MHKQISYIYIRVHSTMCTPINVICIMCVQVVCVYVYLSAGLFSGGFRGGSWGSMEPPFGLDLVQRSTGDRLTGTPLSG